MKFYNKILMVGYGGGHITMLILIAERLRRVGWFVDILPLATAIPYCLDNKIKGILRLSEELSLLNPTRSELNYIENLMNEVVYHPDIPKVESKAYYIIGLLCNIRQLGSKLTKERFISSGRRSFDPVIFAKLLLIKGGYSSVFTTNVPRYERAFARAGNSLDLSTYAIDDLIGRPLEPIEAKVCFVDNMTALKNMRKTFDGEIVVSGNPVFDRARLISRKENHAKDYKELLVLCQTGIRHLESNEITVLSHEFYTSFIYNLLQDTAYKDYHIVIRLHPSMESINISNKRVSFDCNGFVDSLSRYENFIGFTSTALYEAALSGASVVALSFGKEYFNLPLTYCGNIKFCGSYEISEKYNPINLKDKVSEKMSLDIITEKLQ
jgi:hypothetical protein